MCDFFFWPRVEEGNRGELADVVRSGSRSGSQFEPVAAAEEEQMPFLPSSRSLNDNSSTEFGAEDPNLVRLPLEFLDDVGGEQESMNRPCDDLLRVLQISPGAGGGGGGGELRVLRPSPPVVLDMAGHAPLDHGGGLEISSSRAQGIKRRKSQAKRVVCIPAPLAAAVTGRPSGGEVVPSDLWAWRKYGQKPIKGSPYPRGYYRCSSSKGCSARKQVERSRTDPNMLVITYTSEHNHPWPTQRNAFVGSTTRCHTPKHPKPTPLPKEEPVEPVKEEALLRNIESATEDKQTIIIMDQVAEEEDDFNLTTNNNQSHNKPTTTTTMGNLFGADLVGFEGTSRTLARPEGNSRGDKGLMDMFDWSEALELSNKKY